MIYNHLSPRHHGQVKLNDNKKTQYGKEVNLS